CVEPISRGAEPPARPLRQRVERNGAAGTSPGLRWQRWELALMRRGWSAALGAGVLISALGCDMPARVTDRDVAQAIAERQRTALAYQAPVPVPADEAAAQPSEVAYEASPTIVSQ